VELKTLDIAEVLDEMAAEMRRQTMNCDAYEGDLLRDAAREIRRAREDAARLDWLACQEILTAPAGYPCATWAGRWSGVTLRAAIDAAMARQGGATP
jgi:hypothetical protein